MLAWFRAIEAGKVEAVLGGNIQGGSETAFGYLAISHNPKLVRGTREDDRLVQFKGILCSGESLTKAFIPLNVVVRLQIGQG